MLGIENIICNITDKDIGIDVSEMHEPEIRQGARGIVIRDDGKIALFYKSNKQQYKLPGGGIENDESPEIAFRREVLEETGCIVEIVKKLGITEEYKTKDNFKQTSHVFVSKVIKDTKKLDITDNEKDDGAKLAWVEAKKALELIKSSYEILLSANDDLEYPAKFVVLRDIKILEYYLEKEVD
ncbi:MAG: NUDIX domain-containing protein [Bacilli bacterium]|nr:NUDIX domain-containing protein [Bacilli bacterium]